VPTVASAPPLFNEDLRERTAQNMVQTIFRSVRSLLAWLDACLFRYLPQWQYIIREECKQSTELNSPCC
jgi:hypothetical protein